MKFKLGDFVTKIRGSQWTGRVVGTYSTALTPEGYAVESSTESGSVQIYPAAALVLANDGESKMTTPTSGMSIAQRILHVGGRNNAAGYVEFGSIQAVEALVQQVVRDAAQPLEDWVPLNIEFEPGYSETVAFGPQRMMDRLKKWLDKFYGLRADAERLDWMELRAQTFGNPENECPDGVRWTVEGETYDIRDAIDAARAHGIGQKGGAA